MEIVRFGNVTDKEYTYGIKGCDVSDNGRQQYPYATRGEAEARLRLLQKHQSGPEFNGRFADPIFEGTLRTLGRI